MYKYLIVICLLGSFKLSFSQPANSIKPQTPQPPFPYIVDTLVYQQGPDSLRYGVTLTIPNGAGPFPAIILITGSGAQDRDETIFNHKPFAVLADFLTRQGYLVMRVDDRGIGRSSGNFSQSTTYDFAQDVNNHIEFLKKRKDVRKDKIGLLGHSEGGMIAPLVAASNKDIKFIILMAGPGIPVYRLMAEQNEAVLKSSGIDSLAAKDYSVFFSAIMPKLAAAPDTGTAKALLTAALKDWQLTEHPNRVMATTGIHDETSFNRYVSLVVQQVYTPWFRAFLLFDPQPYLKKLHCKVLALNGSKDIQVIPASNLEGIRSCLAVSSTKHYQVEELPGLNHLFQTCKACTFPEYATLSESISPVALQTIGDWLQKEISAK
ncbi:alpha/beta hydrolase family protein [Flavihumibacter profundi]|uniref:alpha/beta hydrolase family protein n=1 Tax=Flavihumibacter profundi TaxID=2716883 RepID=UPI001CC81F72|nr:alpha/beta hydrolase [Flavihumibacter profundi]MBZ5857480.1 alpha/beta hydrolase [Flavihumibacter profundi]